METIQWWISQLVQLSLSSPGISWHLKSLLHTHTKRKKEKKKTGQCHSLQLIRFYLFLQVYSFYTGLECHSCPILMCWWTLALPWMHLCLPWRNELQGLLQDPLLWQHFPVFRTTEILLFGSGQWWVGWIICMGRDIAGICQPTYFTYLSQLDNKNIFLIWCQSISLSWLFFKLGSV